VDSTADSSVYCLPADLLGEGAERVVGTVRDRARAEVALDPAPSPP